MHPQSVVRLSAVAVVLALISGSALLAARADSIAGDQQGVLWESPRLRISRISVAPGEVLPPGGNQVLVYLTADADGRMPVEAVWQDAGADPLRNRGPVRLEAISIELRQPPRGGSFTLPLQTPYGVHVTPLIDNSHVLVSKHRYDPLPCTGPLRAHSDDVVVVYLRSGYVFPWNGFWGTWRVRRGDVDVIPANTYHCPGNAGGDPLELLVIAPR